MEQQTQRIDENMPFFAVDPLACVTTFGIDASPAFLRTLHALAINDGGGRTRLAVAAFAAFSIERIPARAADEPRREWGTKQIGSPGNISRSWPDVPMVGSLCLLDPSGKTETARGSSSVSKVGRWLR